MLINTTYESLQNTANDGSHFLEDFLINFHENLKMEMKVITRAVLNKNSFFMFQ